MRATASVPDVGHQHPIADEEVIDGAARRLVVREGLAGQRSDLRMCEAANRILRGLEDPRITTARSVARDPLGRLVLTYDSDARTPLSERLSESPRFAVHVLLELCAALDAAHSLGVIHGALTTHAVRLTADSDAPSVSVADFGLGHLFGPLPQLDARPRWLPYSPEKQLGLEPTPAEDVYLVGALGFTMLTGRPLFESPTRQQILRQHAIESPPDGLDCEPWLAEVLARCLHKEPEERFASPADLARALLDGPHLGPRDLGIELQASPRPPDDDVADEQPVLPVAAASHAEHLVPAPSDDVATQPGPPRFRLMMVAGVTFATAVGTWAAWPVGSSTTPQSTTATAPQSAPPAPDVAVAAAAAAKPKVAVPPEQTVETPDAPDVEPSDAPLDPPESPTDELQRVAEATRLTKGARAARASGNGAKAIRLYKRALAARSEHAVAAYELGELYFDQGDVAAAIRSAKRATGSAPRNGTYRLALGDYYSKSGNEAAAHKHWQRAANLGSKVARARLPSG